MLTGIRIFVSDKVWRKILTDLNATLLDAPDLIGLNFDNLDIKKPVSCVELKRIILDGMDSSNILSDIFKEKVFLPDLQANIIILMYKSGGMTINGIKKYLGYSPDMTTHAVDTAIYQIRKKFGTDFIINNNGVYKLGRL